MTHIPTVRVANPVDPTAFMTINASDYRSLVHGDLWHEQLPGFDGIPPAPPASYTEAERRFAADLMLETVAFRELAVNDREFHALSPTERMTVLRDMRNEFERSRDEYKAQRKRAEQVSEKQQATQPRQVSALHEPGFPSAAEMNMTDEQYTAYVAQRKAETVEPGETPGHPVDTTTGRPLDLTDEQRAKAAEVKLDPDAPPAGNTTGQARGGEQLAQALAKPVAAAEAAKPAWAAKPAQEPAPKPVPTVEKGPGGKFYVMAPGGGKPLSPGFAKKAEADAALPEYTDQLAQ